MVDGYGAQQPSGGYGPGVGGGQGYAPSKSAPTGASSSKGGARFWLAKAQKEFISYKTQVPNQVDPFDALAYNRQVTASYAKMYLSNPAVFKWAGMAAFASNEVGGGMRAAYHLAYGAATQGTNPALFWVGGLLLDRDTSARMGFLLFWALFGGNRFVWSDVFWQHLAYRDGGVAALEQARKAGDIPDRVVDAWRQIDAGASGQDADRLWGGNAALLRFEQESVLQPKVYDREEVKGLWKEISPDVPSPIPGHDVKFVSYVPGGNIGVFADRWKWIEQSMLPAWRSLETTDQNHVRQLVGALT